MGDDAAMRWRRDRGDDRLEDLPDAELLRRYRAVDLEDGDADDARARAELSDRIAAEVLRRDPQDAAMWFDRGLHAKWRRDWAAAQEHNARSLRLVTGAGPDGDADGVGEPAAWNLGIAATARRDWATARRAWSTFGIAIGGAGDEPVAEDLGLAPLRLNPAPRYVGQEQLEIDGRTWETEVVWGLRLDPARVQLLDVPLPGSGHRHGDVVLHDGEPHGSRVLDGVEHPVFEEIELWQRSPRPTLSVVVRAPAAEDVDALLTDLDGAGLAGEEWTTNVRMLCAACSESSPVAAHDHTPGSSGGDRTIGISGDPADVGQVLARWRAGRPGRSASEPGVELE